MHKKVASYDSNFDKDCKPLTWIITERFCNTLVNRSNNYFREVTTDFITEEILASLQRDNQSKEDKQKRYRRDETLYLFRYSRKELFQDSQVNMSLTTV